MTVFIRILLSYSILIRLHQRASNGRYGFRPVPCRYCASATFGATELDFNGQQACGLGPLSHEPQRGMYLHPTYAVTPDRQPLGIVDAWMWAREKKDKHGLRGGPKESLRWIEGYERIAEMAAQLPGTRLVYVADREADLVPLMLRAQELGTPADWLVRAQHKRCLPQS